MAAESGSSRWASRRAASESAVSVRQPSSAFTTAPGGVGPSSHQLITASGQRNPSSIDSLVFVDAFDVTLSASLPTIARMQELDPSVAFTDGWTEGSTLDLWTGEPADTVNVMIMVMGDIGRTTVEFYEVPALGEEHLHGLPLGWLVKTRYNPGLMAPLVSVPALFLLAEKDDVTPVKNGLALARRWGGSVTTVLLPGAGHRDVEKRDEFWRSVGEFLATLEEPRPPT